jgi:hypothetical protein
VNRWLALTNAGVATGANFGKLMYAQAGQGPCSGKIRAISHGYFLDRTDDGLDR